MAYTDNLYCVVFVGFYNDIGAASSPRSLARQGLMKLLAGGREFSPLPVDKQSWYHGVAAPRQDEYYSVRSAQRHRLFCIGGKSIEAVKRERRNERGNTIRRCVSGDM